MLTLVFPKTKLTSASIPVRWCLSEHSLSEISKEDKKTFILLRIRYKKGHRESFYLYPLDQYSAYLNVHYAGKIVVDAVVLQCSHNSKGAIKKCFVDSTSERNAIHPHSEYHVDYSDLTHRHYFYVKTFDISTTHDFEIDPNFFGAELPDWAKFFIYRYWYESGPKDQCQQRRRIMMFPFTVLPILIIEFLGRLVWNTALTIFFWLCTAKIGLKFILHPFANPLNKDAIGDFDFWLEDVEKISFVGNHPDSIIIGAVIVPIIPLVYLLLYLFAYFICDQSLTASLYMAFAYYYVLVAVLGIFAALCYGINKSYKYLINKMPDWTKALIDCIIEGIAVSIWRLDNFFSRSSGKQYRNKTQRQKELLLCHKENGICLPELTFKDKPVTLIIADIKNKVCKPMRG